MRTRKDKEKIQVDINNITVTLCKIPLERKASLRFVKKYRETNNCEEGMGSEILIHASYLLLKYSIEKIKGCRFIPQYDEDGSLSNWSILQLKNIDPETMSKLISVLFDCIDGLPRGVPFQLLNRESDTNYPSSYLKF